MSTHSKHRGVIVPMVTPVLADGSVDVAGTERLVNHLASAGMGIFVLGTTGEATSLAPAQRRQVLEIALRAAAGRTLVYAGIGSNCAEESIAWARDYLALGAHAVVAHLPGYYLLDGEEMYSYIKYIADAIGRSLVIYNMPQTTRMSIPVEVLVRLAEHPAIIGVKDSENSPGRLEQTAAALCGREDFSVFMGVAVLSSKALRAGFDGLVPSSGNIEPRLWASLMAAADAGRWEEVEALQKRADAIAQVFQRGRSLAQSLGALKCCLDSLGLCSPAVLPPLRPTEDAVRASIAGELAPLLRG